MHSNLIRAGWRFCAVFIIFLVLGCAARQIYLDRAVVRNETAGIIHQVRVRQEPTGKIGEVLSILPQSSLELGFARSPLLAKNSIVTWTGRDGRAHTAELELPQAGPQRSAGEGLVLVYTIHPGGDVTAALEN